VRTAAEKAFKQNLYAQIAEEVRKMQARGADVNASLKGVMEEKEKELMLKFGLT